MKILVVHREVTVSYQVKSIVRDSQSIVRYYNSGLDGLLAIRVEVWDLIICGTDLPVITGFELIRTARTHSINATTPVIFIAEVSSWKSEHLAGILGVSGTLVRSSMDNKLCSIIGYTMTVWKLKNMTRPRYPLPLN